MSKLVRLSLQYPLSVIQTVKELVAITLANFREIAMEAPSTAMTGFLRAIAPLLFSNYHSIIFSIVMPSKNMRR